MITTVILGAGNVAQHLYAAFLQQPSVDVVQCYNRKGIPLYIGQNQKTITSNLNDLREADVYILAVSDDAIEKVSAQLPFRDRLVVHTSGSVPMHAIHDHNYRGVFYPLQTFSIGKEVDFEKVPFCLEVERDTHLALLRKIAATLSEKIYDISSQQRNVLHVAAVFVNNFANYMFSKGDEICTENNVPFEILHSLIEETTKKAIEISPDQAQTGPAIRNDIKTIERHLDTLKDDSQKELYTILTKAIQSRHGKKL